MTAASKIPKPDVRRDARALRDAAHTAKPDAPEHVAKRFTEDGPGLEPGCVVAGYWPVASELDPRPLLRVLSDRGYQLALPVVVDRKSPLIFRAWEFDAPVIEGPYGIPEPVPGAAGLVAPDCLLVPLLAFDGQGYRLGYGGGYYDRTLKDLRDRGTIKAIGLGFAEQRHDALPHEAHDEPLDGVVTDEAWVGFG